MEQELEQLWQEWQAQRKEMLALIRRIDELFAQSGETDNIGAVFLGSIEKMINSGQVTVAPRQKGWPSATNNHFIGWYDSGGVYLLPSSVRKLAAQVLGKTSVSSFTSEVNFHRRLYKAGALIRSEGRFTKKVRIGKKVYNLLHVKPGFIGLADR